MKTLFFDCFAGASGDMIAGTLIGLGLDPDFLGKELQKIQLEGYKIEVSQVEKNGLIANQFIVILTDETGHHHADENNLEIPNEQIDKLDVSQNMQHDHIKYRSLNEIIDLINNSSLDPKIRSQAEKVFRKLGEAESMVHGVSVDSIHFHEVGQIDAVIDILTAVIGLEYLGVDRLVVSPIHIGTGFIHTSHGVLPIPAPATAYLLKGVPVYTTDIKGELITPTGAAILTTLADEFGSMPKMIVHKVSLGAGRRERDIPNVLRGFLGEEYIENESPLYSIKIAGSEAFPEQHHVPTLQSGYHVGTAIVLEANIDDMNPQLFANLMDKLLEAGAMDVTVIPVQMKKNRPAVILQVLAAPQFIDYFLQIIFLETTTIGVRSYPVVKHMLQREIIFVETMYGQVKVKIGKLGDKVVNISPEYEDCVKLAKLNKAPLKDVYAQSTIQAQSFLTQVGK